MKTSPWGAESGAIWRYVLGSMLALLAIDNLRSADNDNSSNPAPQATIFFVGYLNAGAEIHFAIREVDGTGNTVVAGWAKKGESIGRTQIIDFNRKGEVLFVRRDGGEVQQLILEEAKTAKQLPPPFTRQEAVEWLDRYLHQNDSKYENLPVIDLDFNPEANATADEKNRISAARTEAKSKGQTLIVTRLPDGKLYWESSYPIPRTFFPDYLSKNLTEADWDEFQMKLAVNTTLQRVRQLAPKILDSKTTPGGKSK